MQIKHKRVNFFRSKNGKRTIVLLVSFILILAIYFADKMAKAKSYSGIIDLVTTVSSNYWNSLDAEPEKISIEISQKDFKKLEKLRKQALERGVIINDLDGDYVPAMIEYNGKKIDVKLRLKGHMTDHLQNDKWSFRIKTSGNHDFMGMKRFSIQHPGTRGYIYEWIYHELMKREDIIALRYKFINVSVNGRDWGIYAVEENFESDLVENNKRIKAPVLRYNPDLYWVNRYNMKMRESSFDEFASYYSANPEAYRENKVLADTLQKKYYMKAIALIEGLRSREISVDKAFDIKRLAKFHAIIDLVGGTHSIDWSDIKYYYNPVTGKLEPVAYESFTNLQSRYISSAYKFVQIDSSENYTDWHEMIFSNKEFFSEYIAQLERMTEPSYMDAFFTDSNEELNRNLKIINKEFPYKKFDKSLYYKRQKMLKKIMDAPKSLHAYVSRADKSMLELQIASIDALPVSVSSVSIGSREVKPDAAILLPAKQARKYLQYSAFTFTLPEGTTISDSMLAELRINYRLPGSSIKKQAAVFPFPHTEAEYISKESVAKTGNIEEFSFFIVDEASKTVSFREGKHIVTKQIVVPAGLRLLSDNRTRLDLKNHSGIISYSPVVFKGSEDEHMIIESSDSTGQGIQVIGASESSLFEYVTFLNLPELIETSWKRTGYLTFYESPVTLSGCDFYKGRASSALSIIRSPYSLKACYFGQMRNAVDIAYSEGTIANTVFENCKGTALALAMTALKINHSSFSNVQNKSMHVKDGSQLKASGIKIKNSHLGLAAENAADANIQDITIEDTEFGVAVFRKKKDEEGAAAVINGIKFIQVKKNYLKEKNSELTINGKKIEEETKDVDTVIKDEKKTEK